METQNIHHSETLLLPLSTSLMITGTMQAIAAMSRQGGAPPAMTAITATSIKAARVRAGLIQNVITVP